MINETRTYRTLLDPREAVLLLADVQPQMMFGVASADRQTLVNNTVGLAKTAKAFDIPTVLTSIATGTSTT
jgi:nicotinamidase-related amidase